jgi:hypothetical protein
MPARAKGFQPVCVVPDGTPRERLDVSRDAREHDQAAVLASATTNLRSGSVVHSRSVRPTPVTMAATRLRSNRQLTDVRIDSPFLSRTSHTPGIVAVKVFRASSGVARDGVRRSADTA